LVWLVPFEKKVGGKETKTKAADKADKAAKKK